MAQKHILGGILGTAVADALGLPYEGLIPHRAAKLLGPSDRHRFIFKRGMISDDTEHTCLVAQSLIASNGETDSFRRSLA
jgi:ADP-ribosylglycohydrolase